MDFKFIDDELREILDEKVESLHSKIVTLGTGITSSHLGDERNLREFLVADEVVKYLRFKGYNVIFLLVDDSFDPLNFRQLRVAVNKDEELINKFEKYCGMPIKLIPDPYECHLNYSEHFQNEILERFNSVGIYPNVIDTYSSYESGLYDFAKEIVFTRMDEIKAFLKEKFPNYEMKKIFWPLCPSCKKMDATDIENINGDNVDIKCLNCDTQKTLPWKELEGKFGWKLDTAVKWNVFDFTFEPFSKAYLDPDVGSYIIAKSLSEKFFGGKSPEIIEYGQVLMDRELSYDLLPSLPKDIFRTLFLERRKRDIHITKAKVMQISRDYKIDGVNSYFDYITIRLPYEVLENLHKHEVDDKVLRLMESGSYFAKKFLKREYVPTIPEKEFIKSLDSQKIEKILSIYTWIIDYRTKNIDGTYDDFASKLNEFLKEREIMKSELFPVIRQILMQEEGVPLTRIFYFLPIQSLYAGLFIIENETGHKSAFVN